MSPYGYELNRDRITIVPSWQRVTNELSDISIDTTASVEEEDSVPSGFHKLSEGNRRALIHGAHDLLMLANGMFQQVSAEQAYAARHFQSINDTESADNRAENENSERNLEDSEEAKKAAKKAAEISKHTSPDDEAACRWNDIVAGAWNAQHLGRKAQNTAKIVRSELERAGVDVESDTLVDQFQEQWEGQIAADDLRELLLKHHIDARFVDAILAAIEEHDGNPAAIAGVETFSELTERLEAAGDGHSRRVHEMTNANDIQTRQQALGNEEQAFSLTVDCTDPPEEIAWIAKLICWGVFIVILVILIVRFIAWIVEEVSDILEDDNRARRAINTRSCEQLSITSDERLISFIDRMFDGFTGNDDEQTILRILECLSCERVQSLVGRIGRGDLLDEFHGAEWDRLMIRLRDCGLASFSEWDDDATRRFIRSVECNTIVSLSNRDLNRLLRNLLDGYCGDADEEAIIQVMKCLPCSRRRQVLSMSDTNYDDFDDDVHGDEWDELEPLLNC